MAQKFLIGFVDQNSGLETNYRPWLIADNAFYRLKNAYIFRGRIRKRFGSIWMGDSQVNTRLRINLGTTAAVTGNFSVTVPGAVFVRGQMFSIGSTIFTVYQTGNPAALLTTGSATGTYDTTTGALVITGNNENPSTDVYFYPATPVMGFKLFESTPVNDEPTFAFDTQFAYKFDETTGGWEQLSGGTDTWTGSDINFFWSWNYQGATPNVNLLWTTNYNSADGIRYWNGSTWTTPTLQYAANAPGPNNIISCRIIVGFKNRLLFLNTVESVDGANTTFVNRCRYSGVGSPLATNAWRQDVPGNGSAIDAPTQEAIVTAQFLKDRLIVYFERSTWELVYTGNQVYPFTWQKINTELGAESTFSQVPFDKVVLGVGNVGIHACNGSNVDRIDAKIPQYVFDVHNQNGGVDRVAGIRDYNSEIVYWTIPSGNRDATFPYPNQVLTYNYVNNAWGINDDSFTSFGYYQLGENVPGDTWEDTDLLWEEDNIPWNEKRVKRLSVVAGNQEGWVVIIDRDVSSNAPALQITNISSSTLTVYNHNLAEEDYILLQDLEGATPSSTIMRVSEVVDENSFTVIGSFTGTYTGGGSIARISQIDILTKQYNFFTDQDRNVYIPKVDFMVDRTDSGEVSVDFFVSTSVQEMVNDGAATGALLGTSMLQTSPYDATLAPLEQTQTRLWHPIYFQADGECIQLRIYSNPEQLSDPDIVLEDFQLHAMVFFAQPTASRLS